MERDIVKRIEDLMDLFDEGEVTTADKIERPEDPFRDFNERNPMAGGGMLVQPSADGSRPGYAMTAREKNIARKAREKLPGAYVTPLRRKFIVIDSEGNRRVGQKFISVKDPTYAGGRRRVKTPEYEAFLKKERAKKKPPTFGKTTFREVEDGILLQIAEAMQKADIEDNFEYLMRNKAASKQDEKYFKRKQRVYKKGMLDANAVKYLEDLETKPVRLKIIADSLGEDVDWVLDKLDEREQFVEDVKRERDVAKKDPKYTKPRNDYLKVENWVQKNAKKYANPDTFERALIRRFGKDNQFLKDMKSKKPFVTTYFSDGFKKTMLNAEAKSTIRPIHLKQFIKSSLYNFNPKIKNAVTAEIKNIFKSENLPKLRTEARKLLSNNKLLSTFGLDKAITGPYAKVIQAEIGQQLWDDITNFRKPRVGTQEMLKAFEQIVADEFKPMFNEASKAIGFSKNNQWETAKKVFGIADNIAWDHKVPSSLIDKGYADIIEYTKVNPTTRNFNERIKNAQFDGPINKLITKFENATTLDAKAKIKNQMDVLKNNFSQKYGGYLDEVSINLDPQGNLKFSSSAKPLSMADDRIQMLGKSLVQAGEIDQTQLNMAKKKFLINLNNNKFKRVSKVLVDAAIDGGFGEAVQKICTRKKAKKGGRMFFAEGPGCPAADQDPKGFLKSVSDNPQLAKFFKSGPGQRAASLAARVTGNVLNPTTLIGGEVAFVLGDGLNNFASGLPLDESFDRAFIFSDFGKFEKNLMNKARELGYDDNQLNLLQQTININKFDNRQKKLQFGLEVEKQDPSGLTSDATMGFEDRLVKTNKNLDDSIINYLGTLNKMGLDSSKAEDQATGFTYLDNVFKKRTQDQLVKDFEDRKRQVDPTQTPFGDFISPVFDLGSYTQPLKFAADIFNPFTKDVPFLSERQREAKRLREMDPRELYLYNKQRGFTLDDIQQGTSPQIRPLMDYLGTDVTGQGFGSQFLAGGGIAGLSGGDTSGPPPERGPNPQGLPSLLKRVRNL